MSDVFESVVAKYRGSPSALVLFIASLVMLIIGINHFAEDVYSSYAGLLSLEQAFGLNVQMWEATYWTMSGSLQVATVVFFYIWLANTNKNWAWWVSVGAQLVDFLADVWFRSNGQMLVNIGSALVSAAITFAFFTIGSEVFISFGAGLSLKLYPSALSFWRSWRRAVKQAKKESSDERPSSNTFRPVKPFREDYAPQSKIEKNPFFRGDKK